MTCAEALVLAGPGLAVGYLTAALLYVGGSYAIEQVKGRDAGHCGGRDGMIATRDERTFRTMRVGFFWVLVYAVFCALGYGQDSLVPDYGIEMPVSVVTSVVPMPYVVVFSEQAGPPAPRSPYLAPVVKGADIADRMAIHASVIGFSLAADMGTTSWALRRCPTCFERGLGADAEARVALHLAAATATVGGCYVLERTGHRNWAKAVAIVTASVFLGAAVNNGIHAVRRR